MKWFVVFIACTGCYLGGRVGVGVSPAARDVRSEIPVSMDVGGMMMWGRTKYLSLGIGGDIAFFPGHDQLAGSGGITSRFELRRFIDNGTGRRVGFWFAQAYLGYGASDDAPDDTRGHAVVDTYLGHGWGEHTHEQNSDLDITIGLTARRNGIDGVGQEWFLGLAIGARFAYGQHEVDSE